MKTKYRVVHSKDTNDTQSQYSNFNASLQHLGYAESKDDERQSSGNSLVTFLPGPNDATATCSCDCWLPTKANAKKHDCAIAVVSSFVWSCHLNADVQLIQWLLLLIFPYYVTDDITQSEIWKFLNISYLLSIKKKHLLGLKWRRVGYQKLVY